MAGEEEGGEQPLHGWGGVSTENGTLIWEVGRENGRGMVAAHVIVGGHDVIHERSKLNMCGCDIVV